MPVLDVSADKPAPNPRTRGMILIVWILVALFYFNLSYDYVRVTMHDDKFAQYMEYVVRVAGTEHRPAREVRALLLVKAEELDLPIRGEQIIIKGSGSTLSVAVSYEVDIQVPVFERGIYRKEFQHTSAFRQYVGL
jgi:hypothetical protein